MSVVGWIALKISVPRHVNAVCLKIESLKNVCKYVTLHHKTSRKSLGYICSNSQQYIVWIKIIDFPFMPKIIRILNKDHVPWRYFVNFLP